MQLKAAPLRQGHNQLAQSERWFCTEEEAIRAGWRKAKSKRRLCASGLASFQSTA